MSMVPFWVSYQVLRPHKAAEIIRDSFKLVAGIGKAHGVAPPSKHACLSGHPPHAPSSRAVESTMGNRERVLRS